MGDTKDTLSSFAEKTQQNIELDRVLCRNMLIAPSEEQFEVLLQRLKHQLAEGRGEVILEVWYSFF